MRRKLEVGGLRFCAEIKLISKALSCSKETLSSFLIDGADLITKE